jgi:hypothetical protein
MTPCTFSILTSPLDIPFLKLMLEHLMRTHKGRFSEVLLIADDMPPAFHSLGEEERDAHFLALIEELVSTGTVTRCVRLSTLSAEQAGSIYFAPQPSKLRDFKGCPVFGWVAGLHEAKTDLVLHVDCDIMMHQDAGHDWIEEGAALMTEDSSVMFVSPLPGPPASDGDFPSQMEPPNFDRHGNLRFKTFTSRCYLVSKSRFAQMLPIRMRRGMTKTGIKQFAWELCVESDLQRSAFERVHLRSEKAWQLHSEKHTEEWVRELPALLARVEAGDYPEGQGGHHDLISELWYGEAAPASRR